jgi:hypothetical protein
VARRAPGGYESEVTGPSLVLPPAYAGAFAAAHLPGEPGAHVWAYRAWIGEWKRAPVRPPPGDAPHFNAAEPGEDPGGLGEELLRLDAAVAPLLAALASPREVTAAERGALARFAGVLAVRNAPHGPELEPAEARAGAEAVERALLEMGWVLWTAPPGLHLVTGSSPFHAAFPAAEANRTAGFDLVDPSVEITLPLSPRVALHGTWRRRGEHWRTAREDVLLELNARTCASSRRFLVAPVPQVPG